MKRSRMLRLPALIAAVLLACAGSARSAVTTAEDVQRLEAELLQASNGERLLVLKELTEYYRLALPQRALSYMQEGVQLARQSGAQDSEAELLCHGAWANRSLGDFKAANSLLQQGLTLARQFKKTHAEARCLKTQAEIVRELGDMAGALQSNQEALRIEESLGHSDHQFELYNNIGYLDIKLKRHADALHMLSRAGEIARQSQDRLMQGFVLANTGYAYLEKGDARSALPLLEQSLQIREQDGNPYQIAHSLEFLGQAHLKLGQYSAAGEELQRALELSRARADRGHSASILKLLAQLARLQVRFADADIALKEAEDSARLLKTPLLLRDILQERVDSLAARGDYPQALQLSRSLALLEQDIFDDQIVLRMAQIQNRLEDVERQKKIDLLTKENEIQRLRSDRQVSMLYAVITSVIFFAFLALVLIWRQRGRRQLAEAAVEARGRYLAQMSHEIRTPMTGIIGVSDLLAESPLTSDQRELLNTIRHSGEALLSLINDILDLSKLDAGKLQLSQQPFDLRMVLENVLDLFALQAEQKGIELSGYLAPQDPVLVVGDEMRLRQILINLVGNALKFTHQGHVSVLLHWEDIDTGLHEARLLARVQDSGVGMSAGQLRQLFEPFAQVDRRRELRSKGTGLGLAISRQLARLMGGDISVQSLPGQGSTFTLSCRQQLLAEQDELPPLHTQISRIQLDTVSTPVRNWFQQLAQDGAIECQLVEHLPELSSDRDLVILQPGSVNLQACLQRADIWRARGARVALLAAPTARSLLRDRGIATQNVLMLPLRYSQLLTLLNQSDHAAAAKTTDAPAIAARTGAGPAHALVVDDNEVNRKVAVKLLEKLGLKAEAVDGGLAALQVLANGHYDLVLMDCQMPDLDGYATTQQLRKRETEQHKPRQLIVAVTANALKGDREKCMEAGMDDYIAKPVKLEVLQDTLKRWQLV